MSLQLRLTMKAIKHTLTERWYTWDGARHEAMLDEEINMYADIDNGEVAYLRKDDDFVVSPAKTECSRHALIEHRWRSRAVRLRRLEMQYRPQTRPRRARNLLAYETHVLNPCRLCTFQVHIA